MLEVLLIYLSLGAVAGLIAGMFGVGGGVVIVPALIYAFDKQGVPVDVLTHMAVATSLAVICVTSFSSVRAHHRNGFVQWPIFKQFFPGLALGVVLGVFTAVQLPGQTLQVIIGSYLLLVAMQMGFNLMPASSRSLPSGVGNACAGSFIGWISAMFGIGGGSLTVPYLSFFGMQMQKAVATSAACGFPIAVFGAVTNIFVTASSDSGAVAYAIGNIYLPAFAGVALMSAPFAKLGANLAKNLSPQLLKRYFAAFLGMIGLSMVIKALGII